MRIGITGGPGVGKSTVLAHLRELGYTTVSADEVSRELVQAEMRPAIAREFQLSDSFEASELRHLLFGIAAADAAVNRRRLNALLHGPVLARMRETGALFWEVPLLVETGLCGLFDRIWLVDCGQEEQHRRLMARFAGLTEAEALVNGLIQGQLPIRVKGFFAHQVIRTDRPADAVLHDTARLAHEAAAGLAKKKE